jgi:hypothetical protein
VSGGKTRRIVHGLVDALLSFAGGGLSIDVWGEWRRGMLWVSEGSSNLSISGNVWEKEEGKCHTYEDALKAWGHVHESCRNRERVVNVELGLGNGKYVVRTSVKEREPV